jgi:hypothetical protein
MTKLQKIILGIVAVITVMLLFTVAQMSSKNSNLGGTFAQVTQFFPEGLNAGRLNQFAVTSTGAFGYATGAGCAVTQATDRSTGVTCNGLSGAITTTATSLAAGAEAEFTVTNSFVSVGDVVQVSLRSGTTALTSVVDVSATANGSFKLILSNLNASTADTGASIINFVIIKAVSA